MFLVVGWLSSASTLIVSSPAVAASFPGDFDADDDVDGKDLAIFANNSSLMDVTPFAADFGKIGTGPVVTGTTYYASNSGNDDHDGLSPATAWRTVGHVNGQSYLPGDAVFFKRGDTWRETLNISSSGTAEAYITFGAYGMGARPRILGSEQVPSWMAESGYTHVWRSGNTLNPPMSPGYGSHPASIFLGEMDGSVSWGRMQGIHDYNTCGTGFSSLNQDRDWCWENNHIYVYADQNPSQKYTFVEVPQRDAAVRMATIPPQEYIAIDGLEMMYTIKAGYDDGWPMDYEVKGLDIKNCHIGYVGVRGADSAMGLQIWHSDMLVQNNRIHDSGRRNVSYNVYADSGRQHPNLVFENVVFDNNTLYHGYHTTGFDISNGAGFNDTFRNFVFKNNNIIHGTIARSNYLCRNVLISGSGTQVTGMDHNLYFQDDPTQRLIEEFMVSGPIGLSLQSSEEILLRAL